VNDGRHAGGNITALRSAYASAFRAYLVANDEHGLHAAYELGRDAVARGLGLLELAATHHDVVLAQLDDSCQAEDARRIAHAAGDFLQEALSAYEMVRRGLGETLQAVALERRQAAMLRHLSTLLADTSLAARSLSSLKEALQLAAEHGRELTHARWCLAEADTGVRGPALTSAVSGSPPPSVAELTRQAWAAVLRQDGSGEVVRVSSASAVLAAPLAALDGGSLGMVVVGSEPGREFTDAETAVLAHIAQMASAAVERASRYAR